MPDLKSNSQEIKNSAITKPEPEIVYFEAKNPAFAQVESENIISRRQALAIIGNRLEFEPEKIAFLQELPWEDMPVWFRCVVEGVPLEKMVQMRAEHRKSIEVMHITAEYLQEWVMDLSPLVQKANRMEQQTTKALSDYEYVKDIYLKELLSIQKQDREMQEQFLKEKDRMIRIQEERIGELQQQLKERTALKREKLSPPVVERAKEKGSRGLFWKKRADKRRAVEDLSEFISLYIHNPDYNLEQKEYLLDCLEQGDTTRDIKRFASAGLSVVHMKRLRQITLKRRMESDQSKDSPSKKSSNDAQ